MGGLFRLDSFIEKLQLTANASQPAVFVYVIWFYNKFTLLYWWHG